MEKRLIKQGNSLALIIDKAMRRQLELGPSLRVEVKASGRRLVVEAVPEATVRAREERLESSARAVTLDLDALPILRALVDDISAAELGQLDPRNAGHHPVILLGIDPTTVPGFETVLRRCTVFLDERRQGQPRERALEIAVGTVPYLDIETIPLTA